MRARSMSVLILLLGGCSGGDAAPPELDGGGDPGVVPAPAMIEGFLAVAPLVSCQDVAGPGWLRSLTPAGGGRFLALSEDGSEVRLLDSGLRLLSLRGLPIGAVQDPVDAWLLRDTLVVADGPGRALHVRAWGDSVGAFERMTLPFTPHALVPVGPALGIIPLGGRESLLFVREDEQLRALPLPPPAFEDPRLRILAGALEATALDRGRAVLAHPLLVPSLYLVDEGTVVRYPAPIPDGESRAVGRIPRPPFDEDDMMGLLAPALDLSPSGANSILVLTRSGGRREGFREKALLEVQVPAMRWAGAVRLPVNAVLLGPGDGTEVRIMDDAGRWHRCGAPRSSTPDAPVPSRHGARAGESS